MAKVTDFTGSTYGKWIVLERVENNKEGKTRWLCRCSCGTERSIPGFNLRTGGCTQCLSCANSKSNIKHGLKKHPLYVLWNGIQYRCLNQKAKNYKNYGGRGIQVHPDFQGSPELFIQYVEQNLGPKPTPQHSLDRIDNDGDYAPGNLKWSNQREQGLNRRQRSNQTGFKYVSRKGDRYRAQVSVQGKKKWLGTFDTPEEAHQAAIQFLSVNGI